MAGKVFYLYKKKPMSFLLLLLYCGLLILLIKNIPFYKSGSFNWQILSGVFLSKFVAGIILYLVYAYFYGDRESADVFKYFDDGNILFSSLNENPIDYLRMVTGIGAESPHLMKYYDTCVFWIKDFNYGLINDNRIVIRFNALVRLISFGNIHIHTLFMSFLSFTGLWALFKVFETQFKKQKWGLLLVVFFLPSVWFWTSGLLKEGLLVFAFGMLIYLINNLLQSKFGMKTGVGIFICLAILLFSKLYFLIAALPGILFLFVDKYFPYKHRILSFLAVHSVIIIMLWFSKPLTGYDFPKIIAQKQNDFVNFTNSLNQVGSKVDMEKLEPTFTDMILKTPKALFTVLFRPSIIEIHNPMVALAAFENLLLLLLFILAMVFFSNKQVHEPYFLFALSFTLILFTLIGLTTPILGALVRYKAPALPFLGILLLYLIDFAKLETTFKKIKNE